MYLDNTDKEIIVDYLVKNRKMLKSLPKVKTLTKDFRKALKDNGSEFHFDIKVEYLSFCKTIIAEDVGRNTGLSVDGIIYTLDCMSFDNFFCYMTNGKFKKLL